MPLAGSLDIRTLLEDAPEVTLSDRALRIDAVDVLQVMYEIGFSDVEALVPAALNPTIPPVVGFLVYQATESEFGPFSLAQVRLTARAGVRPRAYLVSACCDNPSAAAALSGSWGYRIRPADVHVRRYHDRVECRVISNRQTILDVALVDPTPITGHDIQYPPGMHLAHVEEAGQRQPRLVQVDSEYEFHRADRGRPELGSFDPGAWGDARLIPVEPVSASFASCDVTLTNVRYVCNPDIPASEGTRNVEKQIVPG